MLKAKRYPELWNISSGFSKQLVEEHYTLYTAYVSNANELLKAKAILNDVDDGPGLAPLKAGLEQRITFEMNGVKLHELYFEQLLKRSLPTDEIRAAFAADFGSLEQAIARLKDLSKTRGVGWAVIYKSSTTHQMEMQWIQLHSIDIPVDSKMIIVVDCWEHAFIRDYRANDRAAYIEAFFDNFNWEAVMYRLADAKMLNLRTRI